MFRNLIYFKQVESDPRADALEGKHVDAPDHDVSFTIVKNGRQVVGRFQYHKCLERMERVFCFCASLSTMALRKFGDACIEFSDAAELARRMQKELLRRRAHDIEMPPIIAKQITYYDVTQAAPPGVDIRNPRHLPFLKRTSYSDEMEFRFVWARVGGHSLKQMMTNERFSEAQEMKGKRSSNFLLEVGSLEDIARRVDF